MDAPTRNGIECAKVDVLNHYLNRGRRHHEDYETIGIDLTKNVFQLHGVDAQGKAVLKKQIKRDQMAALFANLPPCLIGIEACGSAHYWARKLQGFAIR